MNCGINRTTATNGCTANSSLMNVKLRWIWNVLLAIALLHIPLAAQQMIDEDFRFSAETEAGLRAEIDSVLRYLWGDPESQEPRNQYDCFLRIWSNLVTAYRNLYGVEVSTRRFTDQFIEDVNGLTLPELVDFARKTAIQGHEMILRYTAEDAAMWDSMSQRERDPEKREDMIRRRDALLELIETDREKFRKELELFDCFDGYEEA